MQDYSSNAKTETQQNASEFSILYGAFYDARADYENILERLVNLGHRILNSNYPTPEVATKEQPVKPEGFLTDMQREGSRFKQLNKRLAEVVDKLQKIV